MARHQVKYYKVVPLLVKENACIMETFPSTGTALSKSAGWVSHIRVDYSRVSHIDSPTASARWRGGVACARRKWKVLLLWLAQVCLIRSPGATAVSSPPTVTLRSKGHAALGMSTHGNHALARLTCSSTLGLCMNT